MCTFCRRRAPHSYTLTRRAREWERLVAPVCGRCLALLREAGARGGKLKRTGETWYAGHGYGLYRPAHER